MKEISEVLDKALKIDTETKELVLKSFYNQSIYDAFVASLQKTSAK